MDASEIAAFRQRYKIALIERLALQTAFVVRVTAGRLSPEEARKNIKEWLDHNTEIADKAYGEHFRDPALSALYADEVKEIIEEMKTIVDGLADATKHLSRNG